MSGTAKCRVCGKEFTPCRTPNPNGMFRWREVACSFECGQEYLQRVMEARLGARLDDAPQPDMPTDEPVAAKAKKARKPRKVAEEAGQPADEVTTEEVGEVVDAWSVDAADPVGDDGANDNLE